MTDTIPVPRPPVANVADMAQHELKRLRLRVKELETLLAELMSENDYRPTFMPSEWHMFVDESDAEDAAAPYPITDLVPVIWPGHTGSTEVAGWIVEVGDPDGAFLGYLGAIK